MEQSIHIHAIAGQPQYFLHIDNVRAPGTTSKPPVHTRQDTMNPATPAHHGLSPSGPFPKTCARPWHLKPRSSRGRHRRCAPSSGLAARLRAKPHREPCGEGAGANDSHSHTDNSESVLPGGRARWRSRRRTRWRRRRPAAAATLLCRAARALISTSETNLPK